MWLLWIVLLQVYRARDRGKDREVTSIAAAEEERGADDNQEDREGAKAEDNMSP
jgi:hypothetical protein